MKQGYTISIYLDTRRAKANGKYPVKLRVYTSAPRRRKYYGTIFDFTEKEFEGIWRSAKPRKEQKDIRKQLLAIETKAENIAKKLNPFTFEQFEKELYRNSGDGLKVKYHYENAVNELLKNNQIGTANTYQLAEKSIKRFLEGTGRQSYNALTFYDITTDWLKGYERFMCDTEKKSHTTVSIYLRTLRTLFNKAIDNKEIEKDFYPFGKKKYQVPNSRNVKKALNKAELKALFQAKAVTPEQQKAKDFWFFSYSCNGMNVKDIALLRYKDIENDRIEFYRAKTSFTSKGDQRPIIAYLNDYTKSIIEKYGNPNKAPNQIIFDVVRDNQTAEQRQKAVKNFTRFINQHLKKLCKQNGLPENISTYWARHSFASNFVLNGATIVDTMESLGHSNIQTTQNYLRSFDSDTKKELANSLMDFE